MNVLRGRSARRSLTVFIVAAAMIAIGVQADVASAAPASTATTRQYVVTTSGRATPSVASLNRSLAASVRVVRVQSLGRGLAVVTVRSTTTTTVSTTRALESTAAVVSAAPDSAITLAGAASPVHVTDTDFADQWDLWDADSTKRAGGLGVDAPRAWQRTTGSSNVVVAVLDTGITAHPDLAGAKLAAGYDFVTNDPTEGVTSGDGQGTDGGWDPDPSDPGDACALDGTPSSWHGTFVAGEIVAQRNGAGVVGEAAGVTLEPIRLLGACGGSESNEIAAITWASGGQVTAADGTVLTNPRPANVLSLSLGGEESCDPVLQAAITAAVARGVAIVVAAGNENEPLADSAPANCTGVIRVVATTRAGNRAGYSDYGSAAAPATVAAPGGSDADPVVSDGWSSDGAFTAAGNRPVVLAAEGTSMATPRVAAAIGLLLSAHPGLLPDQVAAALAATATPFPKGSTCTVTRCGAGVVNTGNLVGANSRFLNTVRPRITGTLRVHSTVAVTRGAWVPLPAGTAIRYQWYRGATRIGGATAAHYRVTAADLGRRLSARVTVSKSGFSTAWRTAGFRTVLKAK